MSLEAGAVGRGGALAGRRVGVGRGRCGLRPVESEGAEGEASAMGDPSQGRDVDMLMSSLEMTVEAL